MQKVKVIGQTAQAGVAKTFIKSPCHSKYFICSFARPGTEWYNARGFDISGWCPYGLHVLCHGGRMRCSLSLQDKKELLRQVTKYFKINSIKLIFKLNILFLRLQRWMCWCVKPGRWGLQVDSKLTQVKTPMLLHDHLITTNICNTIPLMIIHKNVFLLHSNICQLCYENSFVFQTGKHLAGG